MKEIDEKQQNELVRLVCKNELKKAYELESKLNKKFYISEGVDRLNNALVAGMLCYKEKHNTPFWIKNNKYLEQCFARGWKNEENK